MRHVQVTATCIASMLALVAQAANAAEWDIRFYKNSYCGDPNRDIFKGFDSEVTTMADCTYGYNCRNDEYRSVLIGPGVRSGTIIKVWDSPKGSSKDDWAQIIVKTVKEDYKDSLGRVHGMCIAGFESIRSGANYEIYYHRENGLNGKISRIQIIPANRRVP